jgi:hypothetical protein
VIATSAQVRARANKKVKAQTEQRASFLVEVGAVPGDETLLGDEVATSESLKATLASAMVRTPPRSPPRWCAPPTLASAMVRTPE